MLIGRYVGIVCRGADHPSLPRASACGWRRSGSTEAVQHVGEQACKQVFGLRRGGDRRYSGDQVEGELLLGLDTGCCCLQWVPLVLYASLRLVLTVACGRCSSTRLPELHVNNSTEGAVAAAETPAQTC